MSTQFDYLLCPQRAGLDASCTQVDALQDVPLDIGDCSRAPIDRHAVRELVALLSTSVASAEKHAEG
jgi:hypothetical protein